MARILYVEDNDDNVYMLRRRLERLGHVILVAEDGEKGVAAAMRERPDLILMDLSLPVLSGWDAARKLKTAPGTRAIPIVALSAHALDGERQKAMDCGCDDFETKPVDMARLLGKIERLVSGGGG